MKYYKFLDHDGQPRNGGSGTYSLPTKNDDGTWSPGEWMPRVENIQMCESGYHVCRRHDVLTWLGQKMYEVEGRGEMIEGNDKVVFSEVRLLREIETWNERTARLFAVWCTRQALSIIENPDPRSLTACDVAERFANGDAEVSELTAARDAAGAAAGAAAWDAAGAAAGAAAWVADRAAAWAAAWAADRAAAWAAARGEQTDKLFAMLSEDDK